MTRPVTERDFRMPEFRDAIVEDYEFRADGKLVRKDRWERAVHSIRHLVSQDRGEFEIPEVVQAVRDLVSQVEGWNELSPSLASDEQDFPCENQQIDVLLEDGSILRNARYIQGAWFWNSQPCPFVVTGWKEPQKKAEPSLEEDTSSPPMNPSRSRS